MTRCTGCGGEINGTYIVALDQDWHQKCFVCHACKRPLGEAAFHFQNGQPYHSGCFKKRFGKKCGGCGSFIDGARLTALGRDWHSECFVCRSCGNIIRDQSFSEKDGQPYHSGCFEDRFAKRCEVCDQVLTKLYLSDPWGHIFCNYHPGELPACLSCGRLICRNLTGGGQRYGDGRTICNICFGSAVMDRDQAETLFLSVKTRFEAMGFSFNREPTPFRMVDLHELHSFNPKHRGKRPLLGMARTQTVMRGKQEVKRSFLEILIQYGLPREHFETVAVHELCHAWLFYQGFPRLPEKVEEGLCSLCEYLWLEKYQSPRSEVRIRLLLENKDPVYGDGPRAAINALSSCPLPELLAHVKKHARFPGRFSRLRAGLLPSR